MEKIKPLFKNHWKILLFELVLIAIYVGTSIYIDKNSIQNFTILSIIFSAEFFVSMIVGIAAVYSWVHYKKISDSEIADSKYDSDLQLLRNIDELLEVYKTKGEERKIGIELQDFLKNLDRKYIQDGKDLKSRDKFLDIYYRFISDKISTDQDNPDENVYQEDRKNADVQESIEESPIQDIKTKVSKEQGVDKKNIRYSKNYEDDAKRDNLEWTTWFTLEKNTIDNLGNEDRQIFITNVKGKDIKFQIRGKDLKDIISQAKSRKHKRAGKAVYDLFFGQDENGNFVEGRHKIDLGEYNIEIL